MARVGRTPSTLSSAYRARLRRVNRRAASAEDELRQLVLGGLADHEPLTAIARELGVTKGTLWARVQAWRKREPAKVIPPGGVVPSGGSGRLRASPPYQQVGES